MARNGVFKVPSEFKSEDKWFKYFNRKQIVVLIAALVIDYRLITFAETKGLLMPAIVLAVFITMFVMGSVMINLPVDSFFLSGGGVTLDELTYRIIYRKTHKRIGTKNYNQDDEYEKQN